MKERYIIIPNKKNIKTINKFGFNFLILPLENYSIGFKDYFNCEEINELSKNNKIIVLINKFLHKDDLENIMTVVAKLNKVEKFMIEDLGLINKLGKKNIILYQNHLICNYESINYYKLLGINNVVVSNELNIEEIKKIKEKTSSDLYYFLFNRNILMYSRRKLVSNYFNNYNIINDKYKYRINETMSGYPLVIEEKENNTVIYNDKFFCGNKYIDLLNECAKFLIINLSDYDDEKVILENYNNNKLVDLIDCDYYFLENSCPYKVKESK